VAKAEEIVRLIEARLRLGEYVRTGVPSEEGLALDAGVSRMTARKVLLELEDRGVVTRSLTGRRTFAPQIVESTPRQVAVLRQLWMDRTSAAALQDLRHAADAVGLQLRTFEFKHWDDPIVTQTLSMAEQDADATGTGIAGVLIAPPAEPMPDVILRRLRAGPVRVAVETIDLADHGIPSIRTIHPDALGLVLDHLASLGPGDVDCFNVQPLDGPATSQVDAWNDWRDDNERGGRLFSRPVESYREPTEQAALAGAEYLSRRGDDLPLAMFCTSEAAAIGLCRAAADAGVHIGRDLAVATNQDSGLARFVVPSLTCTRRPSRLRLYQACLQWMADRADWAGPCRLEPDFPELFVGESTVDATRDGFVRLLTNSPGGTSC